MVGVGKGAENNILIKDAESLELAHKVNAIVLDKTGTITEGKPVVTELIWEVEEQLDVLIGILYEMESRSEHPLAEAVVTRLKNQLVTRTEIEHFESITGRGVQARANGTRYLIGNRTFVESNNITLSDSITSNTERLQSEAKTVIYFTNETNVLALIAIADKIKATSKVAIQTLQRKGIDVFMLTGDNAHTAKAVARKVGLMNFQAEVMPGDKAEFVKKLQAAGKVVAMVGDGINDSHALAQADVSIAMGKGSDIAMDVAKMTLITSDLQSIPKALTLSSKTVMGIRQNLFWAFIYNVIGIPLAAGILFPINGFLLDPMIAGAAMALSSVSVVANSLRLKSAKI
jgi:Cu2+-exporting ATPase